MAMIAMQIHARDATFALSFHPNWEAILVMAVDKSSQQDVVHWVLGFCETFEQPAFATPEELQSLTLAFLPATGIQSGALARAYAKAGCKVVIASRSLEKATVKQQQLLDELPGRHIEAADMRTAAAAADVIFWLVPAVTKDDIQGSHALLASLSPELQGKIIIDVTNVFWALDDSHWGQTSSTLMNQAALGVPARWTCAFKHVYYKLLEGDPSPDEGNPHHVFVCGNDCKAAGIVMQLVNLVPGFKALFAGSLKYSRIVELLSPLWLPQLERDNYGLNFTAGWRFGP